MTEDSVLDPIVAALQAGALAEAERLCRSHLAAVPDEADVLLLLGLGLQRQGRKTEAVAAYRRLTELHPDAAMHWGNYATALRVAGDLAAAEQAAQTGVRLAPQDPQRLEQLGLLQLHGGKFSEARDSLLRALAEAPDSASIQIFTARACVACRDARAGMLLEPWREWLPLDDDLQFQLADALMGISEAHAAIEVLEVLLQRSPSNLPAQLLLAKGYERVNRLGEAEALLQGVVASGAAAADDIRREVDRQQAQLAIRKHELPEARALLEQLGEEDDRDYGQYFSLAGVCDKLGDPPAAMGALAIAHARQVDEIRTYAAHLLEPDAPLLPHVDQRVSEADYRTWPELKAPDTHGSPVFVVGFPRSGTTLLEQMLDAHPRLQSMDERPFLNTLANQLENIGLLIPRDLHKLTQRDCDELRKGYVLMACGKVPRRWDARLVDKNPLNMSWLPMIHRLFPQAQFIFALRHPCDVILSCYLQNFQAAPLVSACRSLEYLARAYVAAMEGWLYHATLFRPSVLISRYEDLVADAPVQTGKLVEFLGLDDAEPMLDFAARAREKGYIRTPSYTQVIEPINARAVGHWQRYREYFEPVLPILQPMLDHWGYTTQPAPTNAGG